MARRHPLILFFVLAYAFSWAVWAPAALLSGGTSEPQTSALLHLVGGLGPMASAFVVTALAGGYVGARELLGRVLALAGGPRVVGPRRTRDPDPVPRRRDNLSHPVRDVARFRAVRALGRVRLPGGSCPTGRPTSSSTASARRSAGAASRSRGCRPVGGAPSRRPSSWGSSGRHGTYRCSRS